MIKLTYGCNLQFDPGKTCYVDVQIYTENYLDNYMNLKVEKSSFFLTKFEHFFKRTRRDILVSLEVQSLHPSVPFKDATYEINQSIKSTCITQLVTHYVEKPDGGFIGCRLSPVVAKLFMIHLEEEAFKNVKLNRTLQVRYFHHMTTKITQAENFLQHINKIHQKILIRLETE